MRSLGVWVGVAAAAAGLACSAADTVGDDRLLHVNKETFPTGRNESTPGQPRVDATEAGGETADVDVVVVGGGIAGIAAAAALMRAGVTSIAVLEARNVTGGRIHSIRLGGITIEAGANWVHGERAPPTLPPSSPRHFTWANCVM